MNRFISAKSPPSSIQGAKDPTTARLIGDISGTLEESSSPLAFTKRRSCVTIRSHVPRFAYPEGSGAPCPLHTLIGDLS